MEGTLFRYGPGPANVAFKSGSQPKHMIFVGGLTDGLLATGYVPPLSRLLHERSSFSLVQTLLTSSHQGWGLASLDQDAEELSQLAKCLRKEHSSQGVIVAGHSTGCQDAVRYAQRHKLDADAAPLLGVVLQAPVSDREWLATQPGTAAGLVAAEALRARGQAEEVAFRASAMDGAAVCARRWHALAAKGGDDDMFSSDLSDLELQVGPPRTHSNTPAALAFALPCAHTLPFLLHHVQAKLGALHGVPTLLLLSSRDEYAPPGVNYLELGSRMARAIGPTARLAVIEGGTHSLRESAEAAAELIATFAASL